MATDLHPDFGVAYNLLLHEDNAGIDLNDIDTLPPRECLDEISVPQPVYDFRKRNERQDVTACYDQDKSGDFEPEEEREVEKSNQSKFRRRKYNKKKLKSQAKQRNSIPLPQKTSSGKAPLAKSHEASKARAKPRKPANPLRPEEYLTKEDFAYFEDLEDLSAKIQLSRSPSPEMLEDSAGHKGVVTKIKTSFTHPIEFSIECATEDCNFCELPTYGFFGSFEKEIHCIRWDDGLGFTPLTGGDAETATTMCQGCTMGRAQITGCNDHDIRRINPDTLDFTEALEDLLAQETPNTIKEQLLRWCSMCFSPATYACCQRQESLWTDEGEVDGCGLKLCTPCETKLREVFRGDVHAMADALDQENKAREDDQELHGKVRADVGLLCRDGILMMNLENAAEEVADEEVSI